MGVLGNVFDAGVNFISGVSVALAIIYGLIIWALPMGMLPETKFVIIAVILTKVYDDVLLDDGDDFGITDLAITGGTAAAATVVMS